MNRDQLLEAYANGVDEVLAALKEVGEEALDTATEGWTPRMVVHHLADSETNSYVRLRKLLAEESPTIAGYDEERWSERLRYDRPVDASLVVFEAVRVASYELLLTLTDDDWSREGTHTDSGAYSVQTWLEIYASHAHDHAAQIRQALRA